MSVKLPQSPSSVSSSTAPSRTLKGVSASDPNYAAFAAAMRFDPVDPNLAALAAAVRFDPPCATSKKRITPPAPKPLSEIYKDWSQLELWRVYFNNQMEMKGLLAREELLRRHDRMLCKIGRSVALAVPSIGSPDDFIQWARLGAMEAYLTYNEEKASVITHTARQVYYYLSACVGKCGSVKCPDYLVGVRKYFQGNLSPERMKEIEQRMGWETPEDIWIAEGTYSLLLNLPMSVEELKSRENSNSSEGSGSDEFIGGVEGIDYTGERTIISRTRIQEVVEKLTPRQQQIFFLFFEQEHTMKETAEILSDEYPGFDLSKVQGDVRIIRRYFAKAYDRDEQEEMMYA